MKKDDIVDVWLPDDDTAENCRACHMSVELYQNARQTMGELRDMMRTEGISWDFLRYWIEEGQKEMTPIVKAINSMDEYSTGIGRSLHDKGSNVW